MNFVFFLFPSASEEIKKMTRTPPFGQRGKVVFYPADLQCVKKVSPCNLFWMPMESESDAYRMEISLASNLNWMPMGLKP